MYLQDENLRNQSSLTHFLLLGLSEVHELQILLAIVFLVYYLVAVGVNLLIISAVVADHHLHNPMHFFLMNLAIQDIGQVSVIIPKSMANSLMDARHISYSGCVAQVLFHLIFISSDLSLLTVMAYDRYVAICHPLQYDLLMNKQACLKIIAIVWISSFLYGALHAGGTFAVPFCSNVVNQFFCEIPQLMKLVCSDLYLIEVGFILLSVVIVVGFSIFILVTYVYIFIAVLKIPSVQGRQKAFSTCLPHLIVVSILIFTGCFVYIKPSSNSSYLNLVMTILYSLLPPLMNPIIYSMRNKGIKNAVFKVLGTTLLSILILQK
uniref:Olfactory receptor n=1 Tax=Pogona vitticeps TaxID=103695 RepID=A0A6J0SBA6_9SAUR